MKLLFKISKVINIIALCFLVLGPYGIAITGFLQVIAGIIFLIVQPKDKHIYIYTIGVCLFFVIWDQSLFNWLFIVPIILMLYLTYIIHFKKNLI